MLFCTGPYGIDDDAPASPTRASRRMSLSAVVRAASSTRGSKRQLRKSVIGSPSNFVHVKHVDASQLSTLATLDWANMRQLEVDHPRPVAPYRTVDLNASTSSSASSSSSCSHGSPRSVSQSLDYAPTPSTETPSSAPSDYVSFRQSSFDDRRASMWHRRKAVPTLSPDELAAVLSGGDDSSDSLSAVLAGIATEATYGDVRMSAAMDPSAIPLPSPRADSPI